MSYGYNDNIAKLANYSNDNDKSNSEDNYSNKGLLTGGAIGVGTSANYLKKAKNKLSVDAKKALRNSREMKDILSSRKELEKSMLNTMELKTPGRMKAGETAEVKKEIKKDLKRLNKDNVHEISSPYKAKAQDYLQAKDKYKQTLNDKSKFQAKHYGKSLRGIGVGIGVGGLVDKIRQNRDKSNDQDNKGALVGGVVGAGFGAKSLIDENPKILKNKATQKTVGELKERMPKLDPKIVEDAKKLKTNRSYGKSIAGVLGGIGIGNAIDQAVQ